MFMIFCRVRLSLRRHNITVHIHSAVCCDGFSGWTFYDNRITRVSTGKETHHWGGIREKEKEEGCVVRWARFFYTPH